MLQTYTAYQRMKLYPPRPNGSKTCFQGWQSLIKRKVQETKMVLRGNKKYASKIGPIPIGNTIKDKTHSVP